VGYYTPPEQIRTLPSAYSPLSSTECKLEWAKEMYLGRAFADEQDYYRAITSFKRALFLLPRSASSRQAEIEFDIFQIYYFANRYRDAIRAFEATSLLNVTCTFPAYRDLLIMVVECYRRLDRPECADTYQEKLDAPTQCLLDESEALRTADFGFLETHPPSGPFLADYAAGTLSPEKARAYNALLPGLGYYYVGQKNAAVTSFTINALFIAAAVIFFHQGNYPAGIIVTSLESGWYFGGINGAGLAAEQHNLARYEALSKEYMVQNRKFPVFQLQYAF